ncbi:MAG: NACHT domain-containing protein, partial [Leptolyngbyaceae cyanobacterium]
MTARRSLTATPDGIQQINRALTDKEWSREDLAKACGCSRQPAVKFCSGKAVSKKLFVSFCKALNLDWEDIAGLKTPAPTTKTAASQSDIDALVEAIRQKVHADIHHRCGTMRVLDMEQPIGIGDIYTSVNILEKLSGARRLGLDDLLQNCDLENFDRFTLGKIHHERLPGLEAVERYNQLLILGKPGAGKTTFMKRLATLCNQGGFQAHRVPIFVTLKEFAEAKGQPDLQAFIAKQWRTCGLKDAQSLTTLLEQGRTLVLLDGLDEVYETDHDRILQEIKDFTNHYRTCQFVMTCRIAAREYTFDHFTEVEVADFNEEQIAEFATKWFAAKQDPEKGKNFIQRLKDNEPIQELATNPLLLTLLCLVFGEAADFPANRSELYKEGLDVLLKKWDAKRNIERDQVYKKLSLKRKEDLLSQLAFDTFERGDYFFKQPVVEQQIIDYIRNLPGAHEDEEALQLDSAAVLKSIEAQHGLLVERARSIYSFSHLTFQEYFTARQIVCPTAELPLALGTLATHITEKRYREVFLLTVGMLPVADDLLVLMQQQIELLVADDPDLQTFLAWVDQKSTAVAASYKLVAVRAFYLDLDSFLSLALSLALFRALSLALYRALALAHARDLALAPALTHAHATAHTHRQQRNHTQN